MPDEAIEVLKDKHFTITKRSNDNIVLELNKTVEQKIIKFHFKKIKENKNLTIKKKIQRTCPTTYLLDDLNLNSIEMGFYKQDIKKALLSSLLSTTNFQMLLVLSTWLSDLIKKIVPLYFLPVFKHFL